MIDMKLILNLMRRRLVLINKYKKIFILVIVLSLATGGLVFGNLIEGTDKEEGCETENSKYIPYCIDSPDGYHHMIFAGLKPLGNFRTPNGTLLFGTTTGGYSLVCKYNNEHKLITENHNWGSEFGYWGTEIDAYEIYTHPYLGVQDFFTYKSKIDFNYEHDNYIEGYVIP